MRPRVAEISLKNRQNAKILHWFPEISFPPFSVRRGPLISKREKTHSEPEYARMQNLAWIGPRVVEKSLTEQTNKNIQ